MAVSTTIRIITRNYGVITRGRNYVDHPRRKAEREESEVAIIGVLAGKNGGGGGIYDSKDG